MLPSFIWRNQTVANQRPRWIRDVTADCLLLSREIFNVQTVGYDVMTVSTMDFDLANELLLVGTTSGNISLQQITDPTDGTMTSLAQLQMSNCNLHRVQWEQGRGQLFSSLDNHCLVLIDADEMRPVERFSFNIKTCWSDWNPNDTSSVAVCGTESKVRFVDIRIGSSVHSITLSARSGLKTHRASRCLWSKLDQTCILVGDNEGYLHIYDTRHTTRPLLCSNEELGQVSGMSFSKSDFSLFTSHGPRNELVHWQFDKCNLKALAKKFPKEFPKGDSETSSQNHAYEQMRPPSQPVHDAQADPPSTSQMMSNLDNTVDSTKASRASIRKRKTGPTGAMGTEAYLRCQFYVSENLVFVPAHPNARKSIEVFVHCIKTGRLVKLIKSEEIFTPGSNSITGLLPDSLALYVGGGGRLRVWAMDEDFERKMRQRMLDYEREEWDSDGDDLA